MEAWALRLASHLAGSLLRHCIDKENLPPKILKILRTRHLLLVIRTPLVHPPATNRARTLRKDISSLETGIAAVRQAYDGRPVRPRCRLLRLLFGGVGLGLHLYSLPWVWPHHRCQVATLSSILYNILQLYHQEGLGGGNVAAWVEGRGQAAIEKGTCSGCSVSLTTRTRSTPSLNRSASSRSLGGERDQGLCQVSAFYTILVWKSQEANGAFEHLRTLRPRIRVNRGVAVLNPRPPIFVFPLTRSGLRSRCPPCGSRILWQLPFGDLCQRALSCLGTLRSPARSVSFLRLVLSLPWLSEGASGPFVDHRFPLILRHQGVCAPSRARYAPGRCGFCIRPLREHSFYGVG